jgi:hypothetical protein
MVFIGNLRSGSGVGRGGANAGALAGWVGQQAYMEAASNQLTASGLQAEQRSDFFRRWQFRRNFIRQRKAREAVHKKAPAHAGATLRMPTASFHVVFNPVFNQIRDLLVVQL